MHEDIYFVFIVFSGILFTSCAAKNNETSETTTEIAETTVESTSDTIASSETETTKNDETSIESTIDIKELKIEWVLEYTENDLGPYTDVSVKISGDVNKTAYIMKVQGTMVNVEDLKEKKYPPEAIIACDGYYAGAGDYFYIIYGDNGFVIMHRMVWEATPENEGDPIPDFEAIQYIEIP